MQDQNTQITCGIVQNSNNKRLISELSKQDKKIVKFPEFQTEKNSINENSKKLINKIQDFDWLIFTDVFAAEYFLEILEGLNFDLFQLDDLRVCSFGEAVSDKLRFVQIHSDIIPANLTPQRILEEIRNYLVDEDEFKSTKFLILKEETEDIEITKKLKFENIFFNEIGVYKFLENKSENLPKLKTLLIGGAIDEFIFNSPADLLSLKKLVNEKRIFEILSDVNISAVDEITLRFLLENGLKPKMFFSK